MERVQRKLAVTLLILALVMVSGLTCLALVSAQAQGNIQNEFLALVNAERASLGKTPLIANSQLETAAYLHSKDMGDNDYFSHTSLDGREFSQRITAAGYRYVAAAENIAMASSVPSASKVYDMWKDSPGHYANMIGNYADAGLGVYTINGYTYYTLDLGKTSSSPTPTPHPTLTATPAPTSTPTPPTGTVNPSPTTQPTTTYSSPTSTPSSTPVLPEIPLLVVLSSMILLLTITFAIKLKK
jgi:uncharacterized protein YkwD